MAKKKDLTADLEKVVVEYKRDAEHWQHIYDHGCNDPAWSDGTNLNLIINHLAYAKTKMLDLCHAMGVDLPSEYYLPLPPKVNSNYMADPKSERAKRLLRRGYIPEIKRDTVFIDRQLTLF